jgi:hypothetical protein
VAGVGGKRGGEPIDSAVKLRARLKHLGLADPAIEAAWPRWWSDAAEGSPSARAELRFGVARRLGLDPGSLLNDAEPPRFLWREEARFKHLTSEDEIERAGIASFGRAVANAINDVARPAAADLAGFAATELRSQLLASGRPWVALQDLVAASWGVGIPVVHLRVFPWRRKRMAAMAVRVGARSFILLSKDADYPAWIAFYLAHELGHIALGHVDADHALVDLDIGDSVSHDDGEENAADGWALELLTGRSQPVVVSKHGHRSAHELARTSLSTGPELGIEPGTLALCFGYSTAHWATANGALKEIYQTPSPVWRAINAYARDQLELDEAPAEAVDFLTSVLALSGLD